MSLYAASFALMVIAGAILVVASVGGRLESLGLLRVSAAFSGAAILVAVASVLVPRRR